MLDIDAHNDKCCTGIKPALLSWGEELNQSALTESYGGPALSKIAINIQTEELTVLSLPRKSRISCKNSSIDCISTAQVQWNKKQLFNSITGIFSRS